MILDDAGVLVSRLEAIGHAPDDDEEIRLAKSTLTLVNVFIALVATVWVATYALLGRWLSALIPFVFQLGTVGGILVFSRTRRLETLRTGLLALMGTLPFVLQWSLGGFDKASGVAIWAVVVPMLALLYGARTWPWLMYFILLAVVSAVIDSGVASAVGDLPAPVVKVFWALNLIGPTSACVVGAGHAMRERDRARRLLATEHRLLGMERERSESLLLNILPATIADRLKAGEETIADSHDHVVVLFADLVGFTPLSDRLGPETVVGMLSEVFSEFDRITEEAGVEKIKTIGDEYMVVAGMDGSSDAHVRMARVALEMRAALRARTESGGRRLSLRIGMHCGPAVAGVIGRRKFSFDLWGDTVNTASRMESHGLADRIQVTDRLAAHLGPEFLTEPRGEVEIKGKGAMLTSFLVAERPAGGGPM
ncbi:MAG TPA: adenylate/guanylate cyclase domain-containing protein [Acidimicrobiia bacterium]|nr:adenylate/guanylate cyclase domain-containing protein [Acidimicrobiia bacterium]